MNGIVKEYDKQRGFGFITGDDDDDDDDNDDDDDDDDNNSDGGEIGRASCRERV